MYQLGYFLNYLVFYRLHLTHYIRDAAPEQLNLLIKFVLDLANRLD
jgi:hypothetical protein